MRNISVLFSPVSLLFLISTVLAISLFFNSQLNYPAHIQHIAQIKKIQAETDNLQHQLLLLRSGSYDQYNQVEQAEQHLKILIAQLPDDVDAGAELIATLQNLDDKIEPLKSNYSEFRRVITAIPYQIKRLQENLNPELTLVLSALEAKLSQLKDDSNKSLDAHSLAQLQQIQTQLKALAMQTEPLDALVENIELSLDYYQHLYNFNQHLSALKINDKAQLLLNEYSKFFDKQAYRSVGMQQWFVSVSAFLLVLTTITLIRLTLRLASVEQQEYKLSLIADNAPVMLWMSNVRGKLIFTNNYWEKYFGVYQINSSYAQYLATIHPSDRQRVQDFYLAQTQNAEVADIQFRIKDKHGVYIDVLESLISRFSEHGEHLGFVGSIIDISKQKKLEADVKLAARVFENSIEGICLTDAQNRIVQVNRAFVELTGYSRTESIGTKLDLMRSGKQTSEFYSALWNSVNDQGSWQGEIFDRRKNGEIFPVWLTVIAVENDAKELTHHIAVFRDLTEKKKAERDIEFLSYYDPLTHLPNRRLFNNLFSHELEQARRSNTCIAVMLLGLDRFKTVNDTFGREVGNALLCEVAHDLKDCVSDIDSIVARIGGDEFVVLLAGMAALNIYSECPSVAEKIMQRLAREYIIQGREVFIGVTMGIAIFPDDGDNIDILAKHADIAMHHAKEHHRSEFLFYSADLNAQVQKRLHIEIELRQAIARNQLYLEYQPQYNLGSQQIEGFEALLRWQHPKLGLVTPAEFIHIAEDTGLIIEIGTWVLKTASSQLAKWRSETELNLRMAVNVSLKQLERENFSEVVRQALVENQLPPHTLEIEVTESMFLEEESLTLKLLHQIDELGVQISMDDFGTGYSNMSYLKKLPLNRIKIDRCFVADISDSSDDAAIVCAIIDIARHFGIKVIAEGIEKIEQAQYLIGHGCDEGQGFLFNKPLSVVEATNLLINSD